MARDEILIVREETFKELAPISDDMDWDYVTPHLLAAQDKWVQPVLGQPLYEKIMTDLTADSLADPYLTLHNDFIKRVVIWFACYTGLPFWGIKVVNSGIIQRIVDDGTPVSLTDIDKLSEMCRGQGEFYKQRLIDHLCANSADYPEYLEYVSGEISPEKTNYSGGLNLESYTKPNERKAWYIGDN